MLTNFQEISLLAGHLSATARCTVLLTPTLVRNQTQIIQIMPFSSTVVLIYALTSLRVRDRTNRHMLASVAIDHLVAIWNSRASAGHLLYLHCIWPWWIGPRRRW